MWQLLAILVGLLALAPFAADLAKAWWSRAQPWAAKAFLLVAGAANRSSATIGSKFAWLAIGLAIGMFAHLGIARLPAIQWPEWVTVVTPVNPVVPSGPKAILIAYESQNASPAFKGTLTSLRSGAPAEYLASKQHKLDILDLDSKDSQGNPTPAVKAWREAYPGRQIPALTISAGGKVVASEVLNETATAEQIMAIIKAKE